MKTRYIYTILLLMFSGLMNAQSVPQGMNYQAVARDASGNLLINSAITLKVMLESQNAGTNTVYFTELHQIRTNKFGMFNLIIGKGQTVAGALIDVPWSTKSIYMEVAIKLANETEFTNISNSQLLAVPYAFHAGSADAIGTSYVPSPLENAGTVINGLDPVPANSWQVTGNSATNPPTQYLGTPDCKDLVFKTSAIERMRIFCNGDIFMNNSLTVGVDLNVNRDATVNRDLFGKANMAVDSDLTVKKNVNLNALGGSTIVNGPFTVQNVKPSILTGSLKVNKSTTLNDSLLVTNTKSTLLTGTLRVNGATDLYSSFSVNSQAPSVMTGTLRVDSDATFKNRLLLDNYNWNSQDSATGALVVAGGAGIGKNLNVGGNLKISGKTQLNGQVKLNDTRPAELPDSGALVVSGGVGVGKGISVGKYSRMNDSLIVEGATRMTKSLVVNDSVLFNNKLAVTGNTQLNGNVDLRKQVTVNATSLSTAAEGDYNNYPMQVQGGKQGIAVTVGGTRSLSNNYVAFFDDNNTVLGRIEGVNTGEFSQTAEYNAEMERLNLDEDYAILQVANATVSEVAAGIQVVAAATSSAGCAGLGFCATAPLPSFIAASILNLAAATVGLVNTSIVLADIQSAKSNYQTAAGGRNGVTYESGAGDYAEYMKVLDANEKIYPGDIVGVFGGRISKKTEGADKVMVISRLPVVLGNMPDAASAKELQKVAFLGQVQVQVYGKVHLNDYILPDGNNDGSGIAVSPSKITAKELKKIIGVAWSESFSDYGYSLINTAIGLNVNDNHVLVENLKAKINEMKDQLATTDRLLVSMVKGYKPVFIDEQMSVTRSSSYYNLNVPNENTISYKTITKKQVEIAVELAINNLTKSDKKSDQKFLSVIRSNPSLKQTMIDQMFSKLETRIAEAKSVNHDFSK